MLLELATNNLAFKRKKDAIFGFAGRDLYRNTIVSAHRIIRR